MSNVNYREYNDLHLPIADNLVCFIKGLEHAMQKTNDFDGAMHQLKCIGYDKALATVESVAHVYKAYHKQRIYAEQTAGTLEAMYPKIRAERREQYQKNCQLIEALEGLKDSDERMEELRCVIAEKMDVDIVDVLYAYQSCDVDALVSAITGWDLEALMAAARIIPDLKGWFPSREVNTDEIAFPLYGKDVLTVEEFKAYLRNVHNLHDDTMRLVQSIINFAQVSCKDAAKRTELLWAVLKEYDIPEEVVRMVRL